MHSHAEHLRSEREKVYGEAQEGGEGSSQQYTWQVWMKNTSLLIIYRVL